MKAFCGKSTECAYFDAIIRTRMQKQSKSRDVVFQLNKTNRTKANHKKQKMFGRAETIETSDFSNTRAIRSPYSMVEQKI